MWWLESERRPIRQSGAPSSQRDCDVRQEPAKQTPLATRPIRKCAAPLIDTLTPEQDQANRILGLVQCGHEAEIERLLADVGSLEKSVRQYAAKSESQQAIIEEKESQLRLAEEQVESLEHSLAEFDNEVARLDRQIRLQDQAHQLQRRQYEEQIEACDSQLIVSEHRLGELVTALNQLTAAHQQQRDSANRKMATQVSQISHLECLSDLWQKHAFDYRAKCEQSDRQQSNERSLLQNQLSEANGQIETWQLETQRSHASRRALAEQMSRQKAVYEESLSKEQILLRQSEQKQRVAQLRVARLRSEQQKLQHELRQATKLQIADRRLREAEISRAQLQVQSKACQIDQLQKSIELRDEEIVGLRDALAAVDVELSTVWQFSKQAANQLQSQQIALDQAHAHEERFVQLQSEQFNSLQTRIDTLVLELDAAQVSSGLELDSTQRIIADREVAIDRLVSEHDRLLAVLRLAQSTNESLTHSAAKLRAQLSGGRAKGTLVIEQYEERLRQAISTIETLQMRSQPRSGRANRAA